LSTSIHDTNNKNVNLHDHLKNNLQDKIVAEKAKVEAFYNMLTDSEKSLFCKLELQKSNLS
jgi:ABC-type phosphate transport system auxiliary subunit